MIKTRIDERYEFQSEILDYLKKHNGYFIRKNKNYDKNFAMDFKVLFKFLEITQKDELIKLKKIHEKDLAKTIIKSINKSISSSNLLRTLKNGVEISGIKLNLLYTKPASNLNSDLVEKYDQNIFSVIEEVKISDKERVDLVLFLNGFAIMCIELKTLPNTYEDAINQYKTQRDINNRIFANKTGVLVAFAMDRNECYMTTKLDKEKTIFLPFNMGKGKGIDQGGGNPIFKDRASVSYMWEDVFKKESVIELISKFIMDDKNLVFPRFHQRDVIKKIIADVLKNKTSKNYLIQHSAGSGKTKTIAWLSHRLATLHNENDKVIFNKVVVVTDRVVVDRQLQNAIEALGLKAGFVETMDDSKNSSDLAAALNSNTKIIVTTIQKFPYILDSIKKLKDQNFAVIIDEAHSSTSGKNMSALNVALGGGDAQDQLEKEILSFGKQDNVSMFAFTATPKNSTIELFGNINKNGQKEAFHLYSMKQAIEEGFILDVLSNYMTYKTYFDLVKTVANDPKCSKTSVKTLAKKLVALNENNISDRVEIIVEHFRQNVMSELGGDAKAMIITSSREAAVKYYKILNEYLTKNGYFDMKTLVAFSGSVMVDGTEYSETMLNAISENLLTAKFDEKAYKFLVVANKYQTGFDQPKLCAMYVAKKLDGVNAVQTLSRLNRIYKPYDKKTFVVDFENSYDDIKDAFSRYYTTTILSSFITKKAIYDLEARIDGYYIFDMFDIEKLNNIIYDKTQYKEGNLSLNAKKAIEAICQRTKRAFDRLDIDEKRNFVKLLRAFVKIYEFLSLNLPFDDEKIHKKYKFITTILPYLITKKSNNNFKIDDKVKAINFRQEKTGEYSSRLKSDPLISPVSVTTSGSRDDKEERLSVIIDEINILNGGKLDKDLAIKSVYGVVKRVKNSQELKNSANNNSFDDFKLLYSSVIEEDLTNNYYKNEEFNSVLLNNEEMKNKIFNIFASDIYQGFRNSVV
ncbi:type I restriction endonuclease subunit R [Campylobacter corcagiensis]|uniref:Type I restriction endonuclease subunit R n=1 Tax=Campylobacter corcagiensis TaxID=1448857 RepID=A0A7M1LGG6_9BACT|nr:DEAD/DEAH box helicase family protein [Campylobacter corcagiensis]QKF64712.1 type I restriction/modification system, restriction subunit [Campylobacter corcagiensis]QOQ87124.1 type I restriction endonuclease subunit R [Campylobacter corcagiensis]